MGCADVVPGVSGGTVALITGIYDPLVNAIHTNIKASLQLLKFKFIATYKSLELSFILPLFVGIIFAIISMAKLITWTMQNYAEETWGLFLGMMVGSLFIVKKMIDTWNFFHFSLLIMNAILAYLVTSRTPFETPETQLSFFLAGMIAIVAMILPGISGSFLLLIMGKYTQVLGSINALLKGDIQQFINVVIPFGLGCVIGLGVFSWVLNFLLKYHRSMTMSILLGLMIGSLHKLWPYRIVHSYYHKGGDKMKVIEDQAVLPYFQDGSTWVVASIILAGFWFVIWFDSKAEK